MGKSYEDLAPQLWGIPFDGYIILYRVIKDGIEVIRVVSGYRNLGSLLSEPDDRRRSLILHLHFLVSIPVDVRSLDSA